MRILFVGDVVGRPGRRFLKPALHRLRQLYSPDLVIVNGENSAGGAGITRATGVEIFRAGADVITSGNHVWNREEVIEYIEDEPRLLRPANYPEGTPGSGIVITEAGDGTPLAVVNLMGRVFMSDVDDPFRAIDAILAGLDEATPVVFVDFHAEATSEKVAMGWYLDGRVSAVIGTHTHVATADACILPGGTAYQTDAGMTGARDSVIGASKESVLKRFLTQRPVRLAPAEGDVRLSGTLIDISPADGKATAIERLELAEEPEDRDA